MKVSELIKMLQVAKAQHGDLPVCDGTGEYVKEVSFGTEDDGHLTGYLRIDGGMG